MSAFGTDRGGTKRESTADLCFALASLSWAFKYDGKGPGMHVHADEAAINVNFWITPEESNRDSARGGLMVWNVAAPMGWDFALFNAGSSGSRDFLEKIGAQPSIIPYRANRAVIFDSKLFHQTDQYDFAPGYVDRRINITLLYGRNNATTVVRS